MHSVLLFLLAIRAFIINLNLPQKDENNALGLLEFHLLWMKMQKYLVSCAGVTWGSPTIRVHALTQHVAACVVQEIFKNRDTDHSGTMSSHEMRDAVTEAGKCLSFLGQNTE